MTDRDLCKRCVYSTFKNGGCFDGCNYIIYTGHKRPHDGDECLGYEPKTGRGRRRKVDIVVSEKATAAYTETAAKAKPKPKRRHPDPDREIRAAAKRIIKARNAMYDDIIMKTQHMGDNYNRIV